jgi:hypothetical protein
VAVKPLVRAFVDAVIEGAIYGLALAVFAYLLLKGAGWDWSAP